MCGLRIKLSARIQFVSFSFCLGQEFLCYSLLLSSNRHVAGRLIVEYFLFAFVSHATKIAQLKCRRYFSFYFALVFFALCKWQAKRVISTDVPLNARQINRSWNKWFFVISRSALVFVITLNIFAAFIELWTARSLETLGSIEWQATKKWENENVQINELDKQVFVRIEIDSFWSKLKRKQLSAGNWWENIHTLFSFAQRHSIHCESCQMNVQRTELAVCGHESWCSHPSFEQFIDMEFTVFNQFDFISNYSW